MLPPFQGHEGWISSVAFSPNGTKIISGSGDKTIRVWDASTGVERLPPLRGHDGTIRSVAFSPNGSKIISGSDDETIRVWDASTGIEMKFSPLHGHDGFIRSVAFSPDGSKIISRNFNETIRVWDASTGIVLPHPQIAADDTPNEPMIRGITNINTGKYMGALPVGALFHSGEVRGSTYVGWTTGYKLVLIHFPEQ